jgi:aspartate-semialdehyde dehydrogenase
MGRLKAAVVGATGIAGQQFLAALAEHPLFEVTQLAASERSAGKKYIDAIKTRDGALQWFCQEPLSPGFADLPVVDGFGFDPASVDMVFTALESDAARELEPLYARFVPVFSTASAFRMETDVPILIPGINSEHMPLIRVMQQNRGWRGFIIPGANCTTVGLAITLAPLQLAFGIRSVLMTSLQSVSGAGRNPGVIGLDIIDNVIPYISREEDKVEQETRKILGSLANDQVIPASFDVSATCTRVPVLQGHTECVNVSLEQPISVEQVRNAFLQFASDYSHPDLPSAPKRLITVHDDPFRPQPRLDRDCDEGMTTHVGRIRACHALQHGISYVLVSHNTRMGAARGAVLMAEELLRRGYIEGK